MLRYIFKFTFMLLLIINQTSASEMIFKLQDQRPAGLNKILTQSSSTELSESEKLRLDTLKGD